MKEGWMLATLSLEYFSVNKGRISITLLRKMEPYSITYNIFLTRLSELLWEPVVLVYVPDTY